MIKLRQEIKQLKHQKQSKDTQITSLQQETQEMTTQLAQLKSQALLDTQEITQKREMI